MTKAISVYNELKNKYLHDTTVLKEKYSRLGFVRLVLAVCILIFIYRGLVYSQFLFLLAALAGLAAFVVLVKKHNAVSWNKKLKQNLSKINSEEADFLVNKSKPFYNGERYIDPNHFYTFDLDVFGKESLFHNLNRTSTYIGQKTLAESLKKKLSNPEILRNQKAIRELSGKLEWRQYFSALGRTTEDKEEDYHKLLDWTNDRNTKIEKAANIISYILPVVFIVTLTLFLGGFLTVKWLVLSFIANMVFTGTQIKKIKSEVVDSKNVAETIKHYSLMIESLEQEDFVSEELIALRGRLSGESEKASNVLKKLSSVFLKIQGINFDLGALILNGTVVYHTHALRSLLIWKEKYAYHLKKWLEVIGEFESRNSLANFAYNNQEFSYPELNNSFEMQFENLGHPLISGEVRVSNSVSLGLNNFVILTGSNMSGKSTFLRTLGINLVLAGVGAPICASKASVHPMPILVSMRQSDSLSSGESYFFAEVKRLKNIMDRIEAEPCFVLLDEILRGTNSDDKQSGTIGVIKKIISRSAVGAIATHDLEVCELTNEYPEKLANMNFEVQIINDELVFDYKLRNGICQNKSATFLMQKMEII